MTLIETDLTDVYFYSQKFQEEVGDISLVASVLATDLSDPDLDGKTRDKIKDVNSRWANAWNWSEDRGQKLTKAMIDWQKFRDEELILLNWLSQKEKSLKQVANTDVADEEQVKESLELLEVMLSLEIARLYDYKEINAYFLPP